MIVVLARVPSPSKAAQCIGTQARDVFRWPTKARGPLRCQRVTSTSAFWRCHTVTVTKRDRNALRVIAAAVNELSATMEIHRIVLANWGALDRCDYLNPASVCCTLLCHFVYPAASQQHL